MTTSASKIILVAGLFLAAIPLHADLPGQGPRLGQDRITQAEIGAGTPTLREIRRAGLKMFSTPFNKLDGYGDGPMNPSNTTDPGGRPTLQGNGTFLRINGLDGQTCFECHSIISNATVPATLGLGGVGGSVTNAIFQPTFLDVNDSLEQGQAATDGRLINPPFLYGSGGVELIAREMTTELQNLKALARANPGLSIALESKGVNFGELSSDGVNFDYSGIAGIDTDLVVRPFGRKGEFATVRGFDKGAMMFHFGMQPVEVVGEDVDEDQDGVANEVLVGEMSALVIFNTTLEHPSEPRRGSKPKPGPALFDDIGCAACHIPSLYSDSSELTYSYPEVLDDPSANIYLSVDLAQAPAKFQRVKGGGIEVPLYADLKRHDMGPALAETFGHPLDRMFTTARLWGVADTAPYLHDGRALTLDEAILMHGGEAQDARDEYAGLEEKDKAVLLEFLLTLRTPRRPAQDLLVRGRQ
jgi:hypothetical protein